MIAVKYKDFSRYTAKSKINKKIVACENMIMKGIPRESKQKTPKNATMVGL